MVNLVIKIAMVTVVTKLVTNEYRSSRKAVVSKGLPQHFGLYTQATSIAFYLCHHIENGVLMYLASYQTANENSLAKSLKRTYISHLLIN